MQRALSFLCIDEIGAIVQTAVIDDIFDDEAQDGDGMSLCDVWKHSMVVGLVMEVLGKAKKNKTHLLLGVWHDIGKATFKFRFPDHFSALTALIGKENCSMLGNEKALLGITQAECDGELALHWDLPTEVRTAIAMAGYNLIPQMDMCAKRSLPDSLSEMLNSQEEITE